jgi:predicted phage terminase large subunit-like protein
MLEQALAELSVVEKQHLLGLLERKEKAEGVKKARKDFLTFCHRVYPGFKEGPHHRIIAKHLKDLVEERSPRLIVNIAPRMGKSETVSYLFTAFYLGLFPSHKIIMATHTAMLSETFGRRVRNLIRSEEYQEIFPATQVSTDQKAAGQWSTSLGGQYFAVGVGGALAGRGADLLLIDDPHNEQDVVNQGLTTFEKAWTWFQTGPLQRLMPGGKIAVIQTRWSEMDLTGRLLDYGAKNPESDQWELVQLPPILPSGRSLWPEQWSVELLLKKKESMSPQYWNAQYMQNPTSEEGALIKRDWWRVWDKPLLPDYKYVILTLDGAFSAKDTANFSAMTVFGVWYDEENKPGLILLDTFNERVEFPELKAAAMKYHREWKPEAFVIEAKASGTPLIQELRRMGIPVQDYTPARGTNMHSNDKIMRVSGVTDIFASGMVWAPDTRWAHEVIEQCAKFPNGAYDDLVDCVAMALNRYRQGGFIQLPSDEKDDRPTRPRRGAYSI